ncbi:MAG: hypothetical protein WCH34_12640 [Bacteroidota bacterium]
MEEIIVVPKVSNLSDSDFIANIKAKANAQISHPLYVPLLDPLASVVLDKVNLIETKMDERTELLNQAQGKTKEINSGKKELVGIMNKKWAGQVQNACGDNTAKIKELAFSYKKEHTPEPPNVESIPVCDRIVTNVPGMHILWITNNISKKKALPSGILRTDIYGQTGGTAPADLTQLIANGGGYLGEADKGKFINTLPGGNKGKIEYYILVYILKKTKKPFSYSIVYSAVIG